jgi:hypothetical protein
MRTTEERERVLQLALPGTPTSIGWDRVLERDYARLDLAEARTVRFAYLYDGKLVVEGGKVRSQPGDGLTLALYPGDTLTQARVLYEDAARAEGLLDLRDGGWQVRPNFHFGFTQKGFCWTISGLDIEAYIGYWTVRIDDLRAYPRGEWSAVLARLVADGIFSADDESQFNADFRDTQRQNAYPRPTVAISRTWKESRSTEDRLPTELRAAMWQALSALQEPLKTLRTRGR